jgi:hypothetical protein
VRAEKTLALARGCSGFSCTFPSSMSSAHLTLEITTKIPATTHKEHHNLAALPSQPEKTQIPPYQYINYSNTEFHNKYTLQKLINYNELIITDHAKIHFQLHSTAHHNNFLK